MRIGFNRRLFLLGTPGTEGWEAVRPFRPGVFRAGRAYPADSRLRETLTLCCGTKEAVSPGDGLFPPDETAFETPLYLIRSVNVFPGHLEAEAGTVGGPDSPRGG